MAAKALESVQAYHEGFTRVQLRGPVPKLNLQILTLSEIFRRMKEANARQAAREKQQLGATVADASC